MGDPIPASALGPPRYGYRTDTGRRRTNNEDHILIRADLGLFVVADGVGGRNTGEVASKLAVLSMANFFEATMAATWPEKYRALMDLTYAEGARRLSAAVRKANEDVFAIASTREQHHKMNTTVVALYAPPGRDEVHIAHVGDSRCYRVRDSVMEVLTRDHTLRNEARAQYPNISEERLEQLPKNMLARAIGRREDVELSLCTVGVRPGDVLMLCSDGVNGMIDDTSIMEALLLVADPQAAADRLVQLANAAGGRDNISAIVLRFA